MLWHSHIRSVLALCRPTRMYSRNCLSSTVMLHTHFTVTDDEITVGLWHHTARMKTILMLTGLTGLVWATPMDFNCRVVNKNTGTPLPVITTTQSCESGTLPGDAWAYADWTHDASPDSMTAEVRSGTSAGEGWQGDAHSRLTLEYLLSAPGATYLIASSSVYADSLDGHATVHAHIAGVSVGNLDGHVIPLASDLVPISMTLECNMHSSAGWGSGWSIAGVSISLSAFTAEGGQVPISFAPSSDMMHVPEPSSFLITAGGLLIAALRRGLKRS
jgi:hypothetical protein